MLIKVNVKPLAMKIVKVEVPFFKMQETLMITLAVIQIKMENANQIIN